MNLTATEKLVKEYVIALFTDSTPDYLVYHTLGHTENVVMRVTEIATYYQFDQQHLFILRVAAWFHDIGHLFTDMKMHEVEGVHMMKAFLEKQQVPPGLIFSIAECIMATRMPSSPKNLIESIICDADTYHFGTPEFRITDELVKKEMELRTGKSFIHWDQDTLTLLTEHQFFTTYCFNKLQAGKQQNIDYLKEKILNK